ncbi:uncharacterized protein LOC141755710 [Sebastes fasciatus]|uniref:uncharacterized protein LOC141755710 n=1 Tax=Sebastes fasciatus TaxID=394691 RepID=UPI003D9DDC52
MSRLLSEIKQQDKYAAAALEQEGLLTDLDIQTLTREELNELFAGRGYLKLRRTIFEIIHKKKPVDQVLKELKGFIPHEFLRDALTNNGVLVDYLHILKDMKTQMNHVQSFLDAHICLLEEFNTNQPNQQSATCGPDPVSHNGQPDGRQQGAPGEVMSRLLSEIKQQDEAAAAVLEGAELRTDSDIQMLTIEDLRKLFPGHENIKPRRTIFEIIHKKKPVDQVLKELKGFIPHESFRVALTKDGVLVDYLHILKDMKTQMNHVQSFLDAHISLLEGFSTNQPNQQSVTCGPDPESHNGQPDGRQQGAPGEVMSRLLSQIKQQDEAAAAVLERAELRTDSDIQMLTIEDLCELFPGPENIKLGKTIFKIIHKQKPVDQVLKELKEFIPSESLRDALTKDGVLVDYRPILKDMKTQMNHVQSFLDAHDSLLEGFSTNQPDQQSATCGQHPESPYGQPDGLQQGASGTSTSATDDPEEFVIVQTDGSTQRAQGTNTSATDDPIESLNGPTDGGSQGARGPSTSATDGQVQSHNDQTDGGPKRTRGTSTSATDGPEESHNCQTDGGPQGAPDSLPGRGTSDASGEIKPHTGQTGGYPQGPQSTNTSATDDPMDSHHGQTDGGSQGARGTSTSATDDPEELVIVQTDSGPQGARGTSGAGGQTVFLTGQTGTNTSATNDLMKSHHGQTDGGSQGARGPSTSDASGEMGHYTGPTGGYPQGPQSASTSATDGQVRSLNGQTDGGPKRARGTNTSATNDPLESHHGQSDGGSQGTSGTSTSATDGQVQSVNVQTDSGPQGARDSYSGTGTSGAGGQTVFLTGQTGTNTSATNDPMKSHHGQTDGGSQGARGPSTSATDGQVQSHNDQTDGGPKRTRGTSTSATDGPEESHNCQTDGGPQGAPDSLPGRGTSDASGEIKPHTGQTGGLTGLWSRLQRYGKQQRSSVTGGLTESLNDKPEAGPQGAQAKLKYRMVVSGKTFGAHLKLMERVKDQVQNQLQLDESSQDHEITFLFCPICSRVASDVEAAMTDVKDDKPVILVLMHHTREVKYTSSLQTWHDNNKVVLYIHVFFHDTIQGLLNCEENNAAVSKIQKDLLERFFPGSIDSRGNPQGMGAGGLTGNTSG